MVFFPSILYKVSCSLLIWKHMTWPVFDKDGPRCTRCICHTTLKRMCSAFVNRAVCYLVPKVSNSVKPGNSQWSVPFKFSPLELHDSFIWMPVTNLKTHCHEISRYFIIFILSSCFSLNHNPFMHTHIIPYWSRGNQPVTFSVHMLLALPHFLCM